MVAAWVFHAATRPEPRGEEPSPPRSSPSPGRCFQDAPDRIVL